MGKISENRQKTWPKIKNFYQNLENLWKFGKLVKGLKIGQKLENGSKFWKLVKSLKIGKNLENGPKFGKLVKIWKIGQYFENWSKFWKLVKNLKIGQKFENGSKFWKWGKIENFEARVICAPPNLRVICKWRARVISSQKISGTAARHL